MTPVKERPILLSGEMVRAILGGTKTMTRRVMKLQPTCTPQIHHDDKGRVVATWPGESEFDGYDCHCPYGQPGDQLWVREKWCGAVDPCTSQLMWNPDGDTYKCLYAADGEEVYLDDGDGGIAVREDGTDRSPWKSSIHMFRWASRIDLLVKDVRAARVEDVWYWVVEFERINP